MAVNRPTIQEDALASPSLIEAIAKGASRRTDLRWRSGLLTLGLPVLVFGHGFANLTRMELGVAAIGLAALPGFVGFAYLGLLLEQEPPGQADRPGCPRTQRCATSNWWRWSGQPAIRTPAAACSSATRPACSPSGCA